MPGGEEPQWFIAFDREHQLLKASLRESWQEFPELLGSINHCSGLSVSDKILSQPVGIRIQHESVGYIYKKANIIRSDLSDIIEISPAVTG